ncbi:MAG: alpha/beta fold hydrolase [Terracidiphilus sp.]
MNALYDSDGAKLVYRDHGSGLPVIFLHPTPLDGEYWQPLTEALAGVRAIVPDLRGHGGSELGTLPAGGFAAVPDVPVLTMARLGADIIALLNHLRLREAILCGCSIGGNVLLELWRQVPERVRGMAFVCAKPQPDGESNLAPRIAAINQARSGGREAFFDRAAETLAGATSRSRHPEITAQLRARMTISAEALAAVQAGLATRPDSVPTVATITVPVLAIAGGEDAGATPAQVEAFLAAPGGCEFHLLADAGHLAAYEQPSTVAALLAAWLRRFAG